MLLAASGDAEVLVEIGAIILVLGIVARLVRGIGLSPVPFYLLVGLLIGPDGPFTVDAGLDFIESGAALGVVLLLFTLGLAYSANELLGNLRSSAPAGLVDIVFNFPPGFAAGLLLGWGPLAATVLGGVTYISSSGIIAKVVGDLGRTANRETGVVLSVLVLEDLAMVIYLPLLGGLIAGGRASSMVVTILIALVVVVLVIAVALRYGTSISRLIFADSPEVLLFSVLGVVLLVAGVAESLEISAAVGAFLVGIALSGPAADRVQPLIEPVRDLFAALFFLFFAMQIDVRAIPGVAPVALALAIATAVTKFCSGYWAAKQAGVGLPGRWRTGTTLIARGEFSIVIAGLAVAGGAEADLGPVSATYVLVLALAGPLLARFSDPIAARLSRKSEPTVV